MSAGDYVRTKDYGFIKVKAFYYNEVMVHILNEHDYSKEILIHILDENFNEYSFNKKLADDFKSSPNIIDILEPMDLLYIDISPDDCGGIVVPKIPETLDELEKYIKKIKSGEYILKYVVTHEQLENNMYKVGE